MAAAGLLAEPAPPWRSTVDIYGKDLGDGVYGQQDLTFGFTVGRSMVAEIDDNTKTMVVSQDGQVINSIPVSLGSNKYPTYNGIHVVAEKYESKIMDSCTWGLTGTGAYRTEVGWATRISSSGEFVHSAPWSVWAQGSENVSHGCVNVSPDAAIWFYDTFIPGDPVIIKNTVGPNLEVWDGYGDFQLPFEEYIGRLTPAHEREDRPRNIVAGPVVRGQCTVVFSPGTACPAAAMYFFSTTLRRTFIDGVSSPSSMVRSCGRMTNFLIVSQRSS